MLIYKIVPHVLWSAACDAGAFGGAPVDVADGYIHFSTAEQARETARLHFAGQDNLVLVAFDAERLGPALRWEASRGGASFPHLYGTLVTGDAVSVTPMRLTSNGVHVFPDSIP